MPFLTAEWRDLLLINYEIDPEVLEPYVPGGVELATFDDKTLVSVVGLRFAGTKVKGLPIPFNRNFEEVNLRFYVKREVNDGWRHGVCFVKEIVPKTAVAFLARWLYGERYERYHMRHRVLESDRHQQTVEYWWYPHEHHHRLYHMIGTRTGALREPEPGSAASFLTENYWGYVDKDGATLEYRVDHPTWDVQLATEVAFDGEIADLYGEAFVEPLSAEPHSAFYARGSQIAVHRGVKLN